MTGAEVATRAKPLNARTLAAAEIFINYGRCLEGWQRAQAAVRAALGNCRDRRRHPDTDPAVAAALKDRRGWEELIRETPVFVEDLDGR